MRNSWSGGQYSFFRIILGLYLLVHFLHLLPWASELFSSQGALPDPQASPLFHIFPNVLMIVDTPVIVSSLIFLSACLALFLAVGAWDRAAALCLWYIWACLLGRNPLIMNPGLPYVGWLLLAHAFTPGAPYGSWAAARGRMETQGDWRLPQGLYGAAWVLMAIGYTYSGWAKLASPSWLNGSAVSHILNNPLARPGILRDLTLDLPGLLLRCATWSSLGLELAFAPLALFRALRPWLWLSLLLMHLTLIMLLDFMDLSLGMIMLHLFTFDPAWIPKRNSAYRLFYDGSCGLCHRWVRFVLAEGGADTNVRFSPLDSMTFRTMIPKVQCQELPDSLVVQTEGGVLFTRSEAILHILSGLGGIWGIVGLVGRLVPVRLRDILYDYVAILRRRIFATPKEVCPVLSLELRSRFDFL